EQVHRLVAVRGSTKGLTDQRLPAEYLGDLVLGDTDEIELAGNSPVGGIEGPTRGAAETDGPVGAAGRYQTERPRLCGCHRILASTQWIGHLQGAVGLFLVGRLIWQVEERAPQ